MNRVLYGCGVHGNRQEILHIHSFTRMRAAAEDIDHRHWHSDLLRTGQLGDALI
ncbi:hypothetical protein D3C85_1887110 [compost metagenome]